MNSVADPLKKSQKVLTQHERQLQIVRAERDRRISRPSVSNIPRSK